MTTFDQLRLLCLALDLEQIMEYWRYSFDG